ncbi:MAG: membrane protein insertion efficiency factor YidD [Clostridia bacterium]
MKKLGKLFLRFYKQCINPLLFSNCKFTPSCSSYCYQSIEKYGIFRGSLRGFLRILRCNPFSKGGFNPVRDNLKGKAKWVL